MTAVLVGVSDRLVCEFAHKIQMSSTDLVIVRADDGAIEGFKVATTCYGNPKKLEQLEQPKKQRKRAQWKQEINR